MKCDFCGHEESATYNNESIAYFVDYKDTPWCWIPKNHKDCANPESRKEGY